MSWKNMRHCFLLQSGLFTIMFSFFFLSFFVYFFPPTCNSLCFSWFFFFVFLFPGIYITAGRNTFLSLGDLRPVQQIGPLPGWSITLCAQERTSLHVSRCWNISSPDVDAGTWWAAGWRGRAVGVGLFMNKAIQISHKWSFQSIRISDLFQSFNNWSSTVTFSTVHQANQSHMFWFCPRCNISGLMLLLCALLDLFPVLLLVLLFIFRADCGTPEANPSQLVTLWWFFVYPVVCSYLAS